MNTLNNSMLLLLTAGVIILILFILLIVLFVKLSGLTRRLEKLEGRMARFMHGSQARSLEDSIARMFEEHDDLQKQQKENRKDIQDIYDRMQSMIQKVGVVKYDAFSQMGGNLSSAIAILDQNDNGFIMNTVQSVDGCYSYVKEVRNGKPDMDVGKEEQEAMNKAMGLVRENQTETAVRREKRPLSDKAVRRENHGG